VETVLYVGGGGRGPALVGSAGAARQLGPGEILLVRRGRHAPWTREYLFRFVNEPGEAIGVLESTDVDYVVIDERGLGSAAPPFAESLSNRVCQACATPTGGRLRERVVVLLDEGPRAAEYAFGVGRLRAGALLVDPEPEELFGSFELTRGAARGRKVALCLAGGGIEGLIYELGVLRALETFLPNHPLVDVDMFLGISAGAFLGAFLANGVGPDELARGFDEGSARVERIGRRDIFDLNVGELGARLVRFAGKTLRSPRRAPQNLLRVVPSGMFAGRRLEKWLERQFTRPGMTNAFSQLRRELYIGVTDQDTSQHVVLGAPGRQDIPVSRAVRASTALTPFYTPVTIQGRSYVDGGFTRTMNLSYAVDRGAGLVIAVDPLIPVQAAPGYVEARGGTYEAVQGLKSFMQSRFVRSFAKFQELHPEVDVVQFHPEGEETRPLSGTMMRYFYRTDVQEVAFDATVGKIRAQFGRLSRMFGRYGLQLRDPRDSLAARGAIGDALDRGRLAAAI